MAKKRPPTRRPRKGSSNLQDSRWFVPIAFVVLFLALVFLFSEFVFSDQMLFGSDILQASLMFRIYQASYMLEHSFSIPQWMPHQFAGMPFVEAFHSDIFYPPSLIVKSLTILASDKIKAIDIARGLGWLLFLHIFVSGIFMYRAARQFKLTRIPALFAGASYMFAGYLVSMVAPGHDGKIYVAALFPAMMFFLDRGFETKPLKYFSLTGLTIGLILLTPHPQMSYFSLWALSFFSAFRLISIWVKQKTIIPAIKPGLLVCYAVAIGLAFSAIQMYPGVSYTAEYSPRADTKKGWDWATSWSMHEEEAASLIIPEFSGTSTQKAETYYWGKNAFKDNSEWVGTVSLFVAFLGLFFYRRRKEAWFFGGLGLFGILYGLGATTPFFWIMFTLVPKVDSMRAPSMIMFLCSFSVALLAGMGIQAVLDARDKVGEALSKKFEYLLFGIPGFLFLTAVGFAVAGRGMLSAYCTLFYGEASTKLVQQGVSKFDVALMNLPAIQSGAWLAFLFTGLAALFVWLYRQGKVGSGILIALVALPVIDGVRFNSRFVSLVGDGRFNAQYAENGMTRFLTGQNGKFRVTSLAAPKDANLPIQGIDVVVGYHGNQLRWYDDLLGGPALTTVPEAQLIMRGLLANPRFLNLAGAKYLIDATGGRYPLAHFGVEPATVIGDLGNAQLLHNPNAFPRVFLVDRYRVIEGDTVASVSGTDTTRIRNVVIETLHGETDLRRVVLLEEAPERSVIPGDSVLTDSAWIIDYQAEEVTVGVAASQPRFLVLTDTWFPSWSAAVDGQPATILRADGAFRAVYIPAGSREVVFRYSSERYALGRTVTWLTALYLLGIIAFSIFWDRRRQPAEETVEEETE